MDETLEAPEAVSAWSYVLAWSVVVALQLFFCYYLISTGSKFGLQKSRVWLSLTCRGRVAEALQRATVAAMACTQAEAASATLPRHVKLSHTRDFRSPNFEPVEMR